MNSVGIEYIKIDKRRKLLTKEKDFTLILQNIIFRKFAEYIYIYIYIYFKDYFH